MDKSNQLTEAVSSVFGTLEPLEPVVRSRVIASVLALFGVATSEKPILKDNKGTGTGPESLPDSIADFVTDKKPGDTYQKLACLAYYLEHKEGTVDIFAKDLTKANRDARSTTVSNMTVFLDLATRRHGYFSSAGKGKKRLSVRGRAVVEALPDQSAAKAALEEYPLPRSGGRATKKKVKKNR